MSNGEIPSQHTGQPDGFGAQVLTVGQSVPEIYVTTDEASAVQWLSARILKCGENSIGLIGGTVCGQEVSFGIILKDGKPIKVTEEDALSVWKKMNGKA